MIKRTVKLGLPIILVVFGLSLAFSAIRIASVEASVGLPPVPTGLKANFMIGLANDDSDHTDTLSWMSNSGVPWDIRYQYLVGGPNTANDWTTWANGNGTYATYFMQDSDAHNYMTAFSYYELLNSTPAVGNGEDEQDYNNLQNTNTMNAYYANFKLLMDKIKAFGKPVIVQVEPDLWGYLEQRSTNPATTSAAVASSGYAPVAGYANTVKGFAQALVHIRDVYAPNALLAYHISPWSSTQGDVASDTRANFDVQGAATELANYYLALSANYDLFFYDVINSDAGYYASIGQGNRWWDVNNTTYPNFNRFSQYVQTITNLTNKRGMLWQVPMGNTLYRTENNTDYHYQDNRVQYYLNDTTNAHIKDLVNVGIIGILFGDGLGNSSSFQDSKNDGITNPAPINGNNLTSTYSDDDGGNLRLAAKSYYQRGGVPLNAVNIPATPNNLTVTGIQNTSISLSWQRHSTDETGFSIERKTGVGGTWAEVGSVGAGVTSYTANGLQNGTVYYFRVRALNGAGYSNYSNEANATTILLAPSNLTVSNIQANQVKLQWTNNATNVTGYHLDRKTGAGGTWQTAFATINTASYTDTTVVSGKVYYYRVRAYNANTESANSNEVTAFTGGGLVVTVAQDNGSNGTLTWALNQATNGAVISFAPAITTVTTTNALTIPTGITIYGGCSASGPKISITGPGVISPNMFTVKGGVSLYGISVPGIKFQTTSGTGSNYASCVVNSRAGS